MILTKFDYWFDYLNEILASQWHRRWCSTRNMTTTTYKISPLVCLLPVLDERYLPLVRCNINVQPSEVGYPNVFNISMLMRLLGGGHDFDRGEICGWNKVFVSANVPKANMPTVKEGAKSISIVLFCTCINRPYPRRNIPFNARPLLWIEDAIARKSRKLQCGLKMPRKCQHSLLS